MRKRKREEFANEDEKVFSRLSVFFLWQFESEEITV